MSTEVQLSTFQALRRAAIAAHQAPSIHNTQPWRFVVQVDSLEIRADHQRQLTVLDPRARQLLISCGAAVFNARVSLAASGLSSTVTHFPDDTQPDLSARIELAAGPPDPEWAALAPLIELRHTNRRQFTPDEVPDELVDLLVDVARQGGTHLVPVRSSNDRLSVSMATRQADQLLNADSAYRAELRAWTGAEQGRRDGVPLSATPHVFDDVLDEVPIRDFDTTGRGELPAETRSSMSQCLLVLCTHDDDPPTWLLAGEVLEHILLEVTRHGYVAGLFSQPIEVAYTRERLRMSLRLSPYPQMLLRIGRSEAAPATRRRLLADVLAEYV